MRKDLVRPRGKRSRQKEIRRQRDGRERRVSGAEWVQRAGGVVVPCSRERMQQGASGKGGGSF